MPDKFHLSGYRYEASKNSLFAGLFFYDAKITQMWRKDAYLREYSANIEYGADLETNGFAPELFLWCGFEDC